MIAFVPVPHVILGYSLRPVTASFAVIYDVK